MKIKTIVYAFIPYFPGPMTPSARPSPTEAWAYLDIEFCPCCFRTGRQYPRHHLAETLAEKWVTCFGLPRWLSSTVHVKMAMQRREIPEFVSNKLFLTLISNYFIYTCYRKNDITFFCQKTTIIDYFVSTFRNVCVIVFSVTVQCPTVCMRRLGLSLQWVPFPRKIIFPFATRPRLYNYINNE